MSDFRSFLERVRPEVDRTLERLLPPDSTAPTRLHEAMRYSVMAGGKRVRPALVLLGGEAFGASRTSLLEPAAALEMIHTFSLVHDDLPALDDDDLRRGRPTVHRRYDEALAILVGDALLNLGLQVLAECPASIPPERRLESVVRATRAVGSHGMIGGQVGDLEAEKSWPDDPAATLAGIHRRKTGDLLAASLCIGATTAGAAPDDVERLERLGHQLGLMFQIRDDILDVEATTAALGKTAGKDQQADKLTFPRVYGLEESKQQLAKLAAEALEAIEQLPAADETFTSLVTYLTERSS